MISRRKFLKVAAGSTLLTAAPQLLTSCSIPTKNLKDFGLQLYTVRDVLPADPVGVIKQISKMGYTQIESYEGDKGMFWGMTNLEFKKLMDDLGLRIVSSHTDIRKDFERKAAEAAEIGMDYLIDPWEGPQATIDDFKRIADIFNEKGTVCKQNGIRFGYHNHDYTFKPIDSALPQDVLMENTDPDLVDFEMDIYWVVTAGQDPIKWLKKYPKRWKLGHLKDREKNAPLSNTDASVVLGTGSIDWKNMMKASLAEGMEFFIVEQERYVDMTSLTAATEDAAYLKNLKF